LSSAPRIIEEWNQIDRKVTEILSKGGEASKQEL
jgi:hypothetical protein